MSTPSTNVIKGLCELLAAFATVAAAWFELRDCWQNDAQRALTRDVYRRRWEAVHRTHLLDLPGKTIGLLLVGKGKVVRWVETKSIEWEAALFIFVLFAAPVFAFFCGWMLYGLWVAILVTLPLAGYALLLTMSEGDKFNTLIDNSILPLTVISVALGFILVWICLRFSLFYSTLVMLAVTPFCAALFAFGFSQFVEQVTLSLNEETAWIVGFATALSFPITMLSLSLGHMASPSSLVPQTLQLMLSNVVFDALTMLVTVLVLPLALGEQRRFTIPTVILIDFFAGAIFACMSLWCGLLLTDQALSLQQTTYILLGRTSDGAHWQVGPYFWAMHTVFLPTCIYLGAIATLWVAKLIVLPIALVLRKAQWAEKPHHITAGVFLLLAAAFSGIAKFFAVL